MSQKKGRYGDKGIRTPDLRLAKPPLYQLSYIPSYDAKDDYIIRKRKQAGYQSVQCFDVELSGAYTESLF